MAKKQNVKDYLLLFRGGADMEDLTPAEREQTMNNWFAWMGEMRKRGQFKLGHPLEEQGKIMSGKKGAQVKAYAESKESVGGFLLIQARNLADATRIARGCPTFNHDGTVEVRPIMLMPEM